MSSEPALRVAALSKCYQIYARPQDRLLQSLWRGRRRYYREFWALREVSFEVGRGEAVGVIGRNGSGKSTLLQLVVGTLAPTSGSVETNGRIAALLELGSGFNPEFTGRENVYLNAAILGLERAEIGRRFAQIESFAGIGEFVDQPVKTYSSGMVMRLAFAVSVNVEPEILVVDEALAVGDAEFQFRCLERLQRLVASGTTLLFVSHDIGLVKAFCTQAVYLAGGRVRAAGAAEEVAELYLADVAEERKGSVAAAPAAGAHAAGEGTEHGRIVEARFVGAPGAMATVEHGDEIEIEVQVEFDDTVRNPAVAAVLQDRRLIVLAGKSCAVPAAAAGDGRRSATVRFAARAAFGPGTYFVTCRLEDRLSRASFRPVDRRVGALSFEIVPGGREDFLGVVDIGMSARQAGASGAPEG